MRDSRKPWTTFKKAAVTTSVAVALLGVGSASYGAYLFFKPTEQSSKLTPAQIEKSTKYNKNDSSLISTLKANALSLHLATGDDSLIKELQSTIDTLGQLDSGSLEESKLEPLLAKIKTQYELPGYQIDEIRTKYYTSGLKRFNQQFKATLDSAPATKMGEFQKQSSDVHHFASKLADSYAKDVNLDYPEGLSEAIDLLNLFKGKLDRLVALNDLFIQPETTTQQALVQFGDLTPFEASFTPQFNKLKSYTELRDRVSAQTQELQAFKDAYEHSKQLERDSVVLKDFIGKTLKDVKDWAQKNGIYVETLDGTETKDSSEILGQFPEIEQYSRILKGEIITVRTPLLPEKPKPSKPESSSSSSSSETKPKQSSEETKDSSSSTSEEPTPIIPPESSSDDSDTEDSTTIERLSTTERRP